MVLADVAADAVEEVAAGIRGAGGSAAAVVADVSSEAGRRSRDSGTAEDQFGTGGRAGEQTPGSSSRRWSRTRALADWERILRTNLHLGLPDVPPGGPPG